MVHQLAMTGQEVLELGTLIMALETASERGLTVLDEMDISLDNEREADLTLVPVHEDDELVRWIIRPHHVAAAQVAETPAA